MNSDTFWLALALMLVLEGVLPFVAPTVWRESFRKMTEMSNGQVRFIGLFAILAGLLLLHWINA